MLLFGAITLAAGSAGDELQFSLAVLFVLLFGAITLEAESETLCLAWSLNPYEPLGSMCGLGGRQTTHLAACLAWLENLVCGTG